MASGDEDFTSEDSNDCCRLESERDELNRDYSQWATEFDEDEEAQDWHDYDELEESGALPDPVEAEHSPGFNLDKGLTTYAAPDAVSAPLAIARPAADSSHSGSFDFRHSGLVCSKMDAINQSATKHRHRRRWTPAQA